MTIDHVHPIFAFIVIAVAFATVMCWDRLFPQPVGANRNRPLEGLRGFLALGVFVHHSCVWYGYLRTGSWGLPPASVYTNLGRYCVSMFFMVTAFLFTNKLIMAKQYPIVWRQFFLSRVFRLTPLYLVAMGAMFTLVGQLSGWKRQEPLDRLLVEAFQWLMFSMWDQPNVNGLRQTSILISHVTWSLAYEWMYYLAFPIVAVLFRRSVSWWLVCACAMSLWFLVQTVPEVFFPTAFVSGTAVALLTHWPKFVSAMQWRGWRWALALVLIAALLSPPATPKAVLAAMLTVAFCLIACGQQDLFGVLSSRAAQVLGEISYSIYLLHGLVLSGTFLLLLGRERAAQLSPLGHWSVVITMTLALVLLSMWTYRHIELPGIRRGQPRK